MGNLFGKYRSIIITLYNGAFDSSSAIFLIIKVGTRGGAQCPRGPIPCTGTVRRAENRDGNSWAATGDMAGATIEPLLGPP